MQVFLVILLIVIVGGVVLVCSLASHPVPGLWYDVMYETNDKGEVIAFLPCSYCRQYSDEKQCPYCGAGENRRG